MRKIDKTPPVITGNTKKDLQELREYLEYFREQINWILELISRNGGNA